MMKHIIILLLALYGFNAVCVEGLQVKAEGKRVFKDTKAGIITDYGSGVYVTKHLIVTCFHIVENGVDFYYKVPGSDWKPAKLFAWNKENDLALLETEDKGEPIEFASVPALVISGSARNEEVHDSSVVLNNATLYVGPYDESNDKKESTKLCGSSGSPVIADGKLVALVKAQFNRRMKDYSPTSGDAPPGIYVIITSADVIADFIHAAMK